MPLNQPDRWFAKRLEPREHRRLCFYAQPLFCGSRSPSSATVIINQINWNIPKFSVRQAAALRRLAAVQCRFRFLDLCIRFGKMISKVCCCFLSGANKYEANFRLSKKVGFSFLGNDCSAPPRSCGAGFFCSPKSCGFWLANREILMLSGE
jgi:hypothetical protein